jgi:hypothetical protein
MAYKMEVIWSAKARITYFKVLDYLSQNWTTREIIAFSQKQMQSYWLCRKNPEFLPVPPNMITSEEPSLTRITPYITRWTRKTERFFC